VKFTETLRNSYLELKMKIKELKQILETYPDDLEIVLSKDIEGNEFRPLYLVEEYDGIPRDTRGGQKILWKDYEHLTNEKSLVLFPIG
jgi:hypothetical protein